MAEETSLLSLMASIEAGIAGVVAEEVRKLSDSLNKK